MVFNQMKTTQYSFKKLSQSDVTDAYVSWLNNPEINQFLENFGKPNQICQMCPTKNDNQSIIDHKTNVLSKKQWIQLQRT